MVLEIIAILFFLLIASAITSSVETSFLSMGRVEVERLAKKHPIQGGYLRKLKAHPRHFIITILILNNLINILISVIVALYTEKNFGSSAIGIATAILTFILITFGEIIPKTIAIRFSEKIMYWNAIPGYFIQLGLTPIIYVFRGISNVFIRLVPVSARKDFHIEDLKTMLALGLEERAIDETEKAFIEGLIDLDNKTVNAIMTPISAVYSLNARILLKDGYKDLITHNYTRIPVYSIKKSNIVGILYLKDIIRYMNSNKGDLQLLECMRHANYTVPTRVVGDLFKEMLSKQVHMTIVTNADRDALGIVTLEDIFEEAVGEIYDELEQNEPEVRRITQKEYLFSGDIKMRQVIDIVKLNIPEEFFDKTLDEFIRYVLRRKKKIQGGITLRWKDVKMSVDTIGPEKIEKVRIIRDLKKPQ